MSPTRNGTIYALIDPRDNKIRYIGKTEKPVLTRLGSHLATPTNPAMRVWINALSLQGMTPRIEPLTTVPVPLLNHEEQLQIRRHADQGHRLLNFPYYRQHLADLGQAAPAPARVPNSAIPDVRLAAWAFGRLAKARANDTVPAWAAALIVTAGGPAYAAALLLRAVLRALLHTFIGNCLAALSAGGWILWDVGFDAAVREVLLPRLPVAQWSAFWDTYMAGPLAALALSFAWPAVAVSVFLAGTSYADVAKKVRARQGR
ncbi:hypothetical protein C9F11_37415 [Streptomyces sp. YIM 121038]|uniref:hypothetical protein n=1 Tax=Streptomyces sp. YIM 121038 TaxID=2136401 RepID=UPI001110F585|nr:hypothetical protein [Streptomyces sp. YIM 121038]QCX81066.1 hypothetical protein C9F11_37415 [Streptomyces sp. YIM 121038]